MDISLNFTKLLLMIATSTIMSCYLFPFVLKILPFANSKMILAVFGLFILGIKLAKKKNAIINNDFLNLSIWAFAISVIASLSMVINNTPDNTFSTYFISMWVWLSGAYAVTTLINAVHGKISIPIVVNYMLVVCILQCILALIFNYYPIAEMWHTRTFAGEGFMGNTGNERLHGIGCSLDVAGFRFSSVIVMAAYIMLDLPEKRIKNFFYLLAILFIAIIGNMISRSTTVGVCIVLLIFIISALLHKENKHLLINISLALALTIISVTILYHSNKIFRDDFRFGFEGFFSLIETGNWQTNSNEILKNMIVWPDNFKTWIIGDGYINNPLDNTLSTYDPYYIGEVKGGYYKGTDIGYLRYIFYFGILGLFTFSLFFIQVSRICMHRFEKYKWIFLMILIINFIQWFKVSTDLFVVFAPFLCLYSSSKKISENIA